MGGGDKVAWSGGRRGTYEAGEASHCVCVYACGVCWVLGISVVVDIYM